MKPVDQTQFGGIEGNCLMACVASIFEVPLETLPNLTNSGDLWWHILIETAKQFGYYTTYAKNTDDNAPKGYHIASGMSPRNLLHATVALDGVIVHDPHPSRAGVASIIDWIIFTPIEK